MDKKEDLAFTILQEECAELIQIISKIKRFGATGHNKDHLLQEMGDVLAMLFIVQSQQFPDNFDAKDETDYYIGWDEVINAANFKKNKLKIYAPELFE